MEYLIQLAQIKPVLGGVQPLYMKLLKHITHGSTVMKMTRLWVSLLYPMEREQQLRPNLVFQ